MNDLSALETELLNVIDSRISTSIASSTQGLSIASNLALGSGVVTKTVAEWYTISVTNNTYYTLPLPSFSDATVATAAQCTSMAAIFAYIAFDDGVTSADKGMILQRNSSAHEYRINWTGSNVVPLNTALNASLMYIILGVR